MVLTRSKRKTIEEDHTPTKVQLLELVKHNNKGEKKTVRQKSSELPRQIAVKLEKPQEIKTPLLPLTQINASQVSSQAPALSDEIVSILRRVRKVLDQNFKNIAQRLQLDLPPKCLYDLKECNQFHNVKSSVKKASESDSYIARNYLSEERHFQFFHFVRHCMCGFGNFPGSEICLKILQEILKYKSNASSQFSTNYIISELYSIFTTIIQKYPPCSFRQEYFNMFIVGFYVEGLSDKREPVLPTIIDLIQDQMFTKEDKLERKQSEGKNDFNKNFYLWDVEFHQTPSFKHLDRLERFERLFMTLDLIVRILEDDTAVFMVKHSHKFGSSTKNKMQRPLICSTIWQNHESVIVVNSMIKKIILLFISMIEMNYPGDKIQIVSRLLSLIGHVINMYEYSGVKIEYPQYKNYTMDLAREIQTKVESSSYYSMDLYNKVIESLRSPLLKLLLTHHLLTKIIGETKPISLSIPLDALSNRQFENYADLQGKTAAATNIEIEKYPVHITKKTTTVNKVKISRDNYLKLLMLYIEAMNSYYRLQSCATEIKKENENQKLLTQPIIITTSQTPPSSFNLESFSQALKNIDLNEQVSLRCVDINYINSIHIQLTKQSCIFYRNEIKNLLALCKLIPRLHDQLGSNFNNWMTFIDKMRA